MQYEGNCPLQGKQITKIKNIVHHQLISLKISPVSPLPPKVAYFFLQYFRGFYIDFLEVEGQLETIIEPLAESNLNTIDTLESTNPSAERIAQYVGDALSKQIRGNVRVQSVTITEATNCKATYSL